MSQTTKRPRIPAGRKLTATAMAAALTLASCGGGETAQVATDPPADDTTSQATAPPESPTEAPADPDPTTAAAPPAESSTEAPAAPEPEPEPEPEVDRGENQLPDVLVKNIATGEDVNLRSFAPADNPIVLWFWAPH